MIARTMLSLALLFSTTLWFTGRADAACPPLPGVPCAMTSSVPCGINLVGSNGAVTDPMGLFTVTVADFGGAPVVGADVWFDFAPCCFDIRLADPQLDPTLVQLAALKQVHATSGPGGVTVFRIMGAASSLAATFAGGCAHVWAAIPGVPAVELTDPVSRPPVQVGTFDLNGALPGGPGLSASDLSLWLADFFVFPAPYRARADYDFPALCVQNVGPSDLSRWLNVYFAAGSTTNGPVFLPCP